MSGEQPQPEHRDIDAIATQWIESGEANLQDDQRVSIVTDSGDVIEYELYDALFDVEPKPMPGDVLENDDREKTPTVVLRPVIDGEPTDDQSQFVTMKATEFLLGVERHIEETSEKEKDTPETEPSDEPVQDNKEGKVSDEEKQRKETLVTALGNFFEDTKHLSIRTNDYGNREQLDYTIFHSPGDSDFERVSDGNPLVMATINGIALGAVRTPHVIDAAEQAFFSAFQATTQKLIETATDETKESVKESVIRLGHEMSLFTQARKTGTPQEQVEADASARARAAIEQALNEDSGPIEYRKAQAIAGFYYGSAASSPVRPSKIDEPGNSQMLAETILA